LASNDNQSKASSTLGSNLGSARIDWVAPFPAGIFMHVSVDKMRLPASPNTREIEEEFMTWSDPEAYLYA
jgi:hypothetical protein